MTRFFDKLQAAVDHNNTLLCVGLDPRIELIPDGDILAFNRRIVDDTADLVCAYKPNYAFYEAEGLAGLSALKQTIAYIHQETDIPVILDAKRGDIGPTAQAYARSSYEVWQSDAVTANPYLGHDSLLPFVQYEDRGTFVLCHTSNASAPDFQTARVDDLTLFESVAQRAVQWNTKGNLGLVVGATYPEELAWVRRIAPEMWLLVPGIGAQGGDLKAMLSAGLRPDGRGVIVNSSRGIIFAPSPRAAALALRDEINQARDSHSGSPQSVDRSKDSLALALHDVGCVQFGQFTLASGQVSPIYIDLRLLVSNPVVLRSVARAYAGLLRWLEFDRLAAIPYAGLPIGTAVALETNYPLIYPRKEAKSYGTGRGIEGEFHSGETVVVLDDLITTGGSKIDAIEPLQAAGLEVRDVVVLLDREQGGSEEMARRGYRLHSALTMSELLDVLVRHNRISDRQEALARALIRSA